MLVKLIFTRKIGRLELFLSCCLPLENFEAGKAVLSGPNDVSASRFPRFSHTFRDLDPIETPLLVDVEYLMSNHLIASITVT